MKKQITIILTFALVIALVGCSKAPEATDPSTSTAQVLTPSITTEQSTTPTTVSTVATTPATKPTAAPNIATETMIAVHVNITTEDTTDKNGTVLFRSISQDMRLTLNNAEIADKIKNSFGNRSDIAQTIATMKASAKSAYNGSADWNAHYYSLTYNPQRVDQKVLSLSGDEIKFTGAAHAEKTPKGANYDITTGDVLTLASIMTTEASTDDFCNLVLEALAERAEGDVLYESYADGVRHRFTADPTQDEKWYFTTTGLCFFFEPYEIGPYNSGVITAEIPYEKLSGLVQPDYIPTQRTAATGKVVTSNFTPDLAKNFSHTAEMIMDPESKMHLIYTEGTVQDIRITFTDNAESYTVFAANSLSTGEAIMVQATEENAKNLELSYLSNGKTVTTKIVN